jgi:peroxiredoxin
MQAFRDLGVSVVAGSVDSEAKTLEVAADVSFPVAFGMTRHDAERIGAWWDERGDYLQPSEFLLMGAGRVLSSTYSSSPVGRVDPVEALSLLRFMDSRRKSD